MKILLLTALAALLLAAWLTLAPSPPQLELARVESLPLRVTLEEEGRTRVLDRYLLTAPLGGQLARVNLQPGDSVQQGDEVFRLYPLPVQPLDARSQAQASAMLERSEAALQQALQLLQGEQARLQLAQLQLQRAERLQAAGHLERQQLDQLRSEQQQVSAAVQSAQFALEVARHERDAARLQLSVQGGAQLDAPLIVRAPVSGTVLQRQRQSAGPIQAGEPVLALGDLHSLEIEVDVLSADALRLRPGMSVELQRWGGEQPLQGQVRRIEPAGFTRLSALGVEEQRVWTIVELLSPAEHWQGLGDGYRVDVQFIIEDHPSLLQVPASALFRLNQQWYLYVVENNRLQLRSVVPGPRSGLQAAILDGLQAGELVVRLPEQNLRPDMRVRSR